MASPRIDRLLVEQDGRSRVFRLLRDRVVLGRDPSVDLVLRQQRVSRRHCEIRRESGGLVVEDLGSANGTRVNGEPVTRAPLQAGDLLELGNVTVHVGVPEGSSRSTAPAAAGPTFQEPPRRRRKPPLLALAVLVGLLVAAGFLGRAVLEQWQGGQTRPDRPQAGADAGGERTATPQVTLPTPSSRSGPEEEKEAGGPAPEERFRTAVEARRWHEALQHLEAAGSPGPLREELVAAVERDVMQRVAPRIVEVLRKEGEGAAVSQLFLEAADYPDALDPMKHLDRLAVRLGLQRQGEVARGEAGSGAREAGETGSEDAAGSEADAGHEPPDKDAGEVEPAPVADPGALVAKLEDLLARRDLDASRVLAARLEKVPGLAPDLRVRVERARRTASAYRDLFRGLAGLRPGQVERAGRIPYKAGHSGALLGASEAGLEVDTPSGPQVVPWRVLPAATFLHLARKAGLSPRMKLKTAVVLFHAGRREDALALLARAFQEDKDLKPRVDRALADARGMAAVPEGGFTLLEGAWLAPSEVARDRLNAAVGKAREELLSSDPEVRSHGFAVLRDLGDAARSALHRGLLDAREKALEKIHGHSSYRGLRKLVALRARAGKARREILELVFDPERYPHPHHVGRGASQEQHQAYVETQRRIEELTRGLEKIWEARHKVVLAPDLRRGLQRLRQVQGWLDAEDLAAGTPDDSWLLHLPRNADAVGVQQIAMDADERKRLKASARVMKANQERPGIATTGEQQQCRITNEYRLMLGRWALRLNDHLVEASREHCKDMIRLGFFSHTSPVEGKRTPYDRAVAAGAKPRGLGENIAVHSGPQGAHNAWITSPGHHRNILQKAWRIMGAGNAGNRWCQQFSAGDANAEDQE